VFGPLWAGAHIWLAADRLASGRVGRRARRAREPPRLLSARPRGVRRAALSSAAWGIVFYLCFMTVRGLQGPILANVMQQEAPAEDRASVLRSPGCSSGYRS